VKIVTPRLALIYGTAQPKDQPDWQEAFQHSLRFGLAVLTTACECRETIVVHEILNGLIVFCERIDEDEYWKGKRLSQSA
jgi:hypothetical protein